jgi:hypothetical protein
MKSTGVTQKQMPNPRDQYGGTVHLFIGTGHSSYKITFMPFTFGSNSIVIYRGLNSLFIFKSVSFSAITSKLSCSQLWCCVDLRIPWASPTVVPIRVRRYLFTHYTPKTLLNLVFEDLRKPKAPNILQLQTGPKFSAPCAPIERLGQATVDALGVGATRLVIHGLDFLVE